MKRTRPPKPRPTYVLEPLIASVREQLRQPMRRWTANEYDMKRRLQSDLIRLESELQRAKTMYLPKDQQ